MTRPRVLAIVFACQHDGTSESYAGYQWARQIDRFCDLTLVTAWQPTPSGLGECIQAPTRFRFKSKLLRSINEEVFFDYFWFDYWVKSRFGNQISQFDLVHLINPIGPRYPCSIGCQAKRFVLGPIGGGLRVPPAFRSSVEGDEPFFYRLRRLDRLRLRYDPFLRKTYRSANLILVAGRYMVDLLPSVHHAKCQVMLDTGIDSVAFQAAPWEKTDDRGPLRLLYVGRVVPYKGLMYVLKALDACSLRVRNEMKLTVVGDRGESRYEVDCRRYVTERKLDSLVTFTGVKRKEQIVDLYADSHLFVFPSLAEAGGNVVLEAMATGRPALVANRGGPAEVVTPNSGFLVDATAPEQFIAAIAEVLNRVVTDRAQLVTKGAAARRIIEEHFDWGKKGEALWELYQRLFANGIAAGLCLPRTR